MAFWSERDRSSHLESGPDSTPVSRPGVGPHEALTENVRIGLFKTLRGQKSSRQILFAPPRAAKSICLGLREPLGGSESTSEMFPKPLGGSGSTSEMFPEPLGGSESTCLGPLEPLGVLRKYLSRASRGARPSECELGSLLEPARGHRGTCLGVLKSVDALGSPTVGVVRSIDALDRQPSTIVGSVDALGSPTVRRHGPWSDVALRRRAISDAGPPRAHRAARCDGRASRARRW